jgi:hypothetical protein
MKIEFRICSPNFALTVQRAMRRTTVWLRCVERANFSQQKGRESMITRFWLLLFERKIVTIFVPQLQPQTVLFSLPFQSLARLSQYYYHYS